MQEKLIRVHLEEVVVHSFLIPEPVPGDDDTTADAAEGVFVHPRVDELEDYKSFIKDCRSLYSESADDPNNALT